MRHRYYRGVRFGAVLLALGLLAGCGSATGPTPDPDSNPPAVPTLDRSIPRPAHVVVVIFENKDDSQVVRGAAAPYLTSLAKSGATFTNSHGIAHPSQPNYIALLSGSTHGVTDDSCPQNLRAKPNLVRQLLDAGYSVTGYAESMPADGYTGCATSGGRYTRKHNPWADFSNIPASSNLRYARFPSDLSKLPTVSFVISDMCHDMHDCSVSTGDDWARAHLHRYVTWAQTHHSLPIITFDEDSGTSANHIPTIMVGPMVRPGQVNQRIDHYNVLRTLEDMYGVPALGHAASAHPITAWQT